MIENIEFWQPIVEITLDNLYPDNVDFTIHPIEDRYSDRDAAGCDMLVEVLTGDVEVCFQLKDKEFTFNQNNPPTLDDLRVNLNVKKFDRYMSNPDVTIDYICFGIDSLGVALIVDYYALKDIWQNCTEEMVYAQNVRDNYFTVGMLALGRMVKRRKRICGIDSDYISVIFVDLDNTYLSERYNHVVVY